MWYFVQNMCVWFDILQPIPVSHYKVGRLVRIQRVIPRRLESGYHSHGITWFTNGTVKIDSLCTKAKILVAGL